MCAITVLMEDKKKRNGMTRLGNSLRVKRFQVRSWSIDRWVAVLSKFFGENIHVRGEGVLKNFFPTSKFKKWR